MLGGVIALHLGDDVALGLKVGRHGCRVILLLGNGILFVHVLHGLLELAVVHCDYGQAKISGAQFAVIARLTSYLLELCGRIVVLPLIHEIGRNPEVRRHEVGIHAESLAVLGNRVLEAAHFQQELGIRIVGIRVVGYQLDVLLEGLLRVLIVSLLTVGIAKDVVGGRVVGSEFGGSFVVRNRLLILLLSKVVVPEIETRALVIWVGGHEFIEILLLLDDLSVGAGFIGKNE